MSDTYIGTIKGTDGVVYPIGSTLFGVCNTSADQPIKDVAITNNLWTENINPKFDVLQKGLTIYVFFRYSNTSSGDITLRINSNEGEGIPIFNNWDYIGNTPATSWTDNSLVTFTYDGGQWVMNTPYSDLWYVLCEMMHSNEARMVKLPGKETINNHKIIDADVISNALGYTPANSAGSGGEKHTFERVSDDSSDTRYRMVIS